MTQEERDFWAANKRRGVWAWKFNRKINETGLTYEVWVISDGWLRESASGRSPGRALMDWQRMRRVRKQQGLS